MIFILFENGRGMIKTRAPEKCGAELTFRFENAPEGCTFILKNEREETLYRHINGGECSVPRAFLSGTLGAFVVSLDNSQSIKWECERIFCSATDGDTWIMPAALDIPLEIIELRNTVHKLSLKFDEAMAEYKKLKDTVDKFFGGYDII